MFLVLVLERITPAWDVLEFDQEGDITGPVLWKTAQC